MRVNVVETFHLSTKLRLFSTIMFRIYFTTQLQPPCCKFKLTPSSGSIVELNIVLQLLILNFAYFRLNLFSIFNARSPCQIISFQGNWKQPRPLNLFKLLFVLIIHRNRNKYTPISVLLSDKGYKIIKRNNNQFKRLH